MSSLRPSIHSSMETAAWAVFSSRFSCMPAFFASRFSTSSTACTRGGKWEAWLDFFLTGVRDTASQVTTSLPRILAVFTEDHGKIEKARRPAASAMRVFERRLYGK